MNKKNKKKISKTSNDLKPNININNNSASIRKSKDKSKDKEKIETPELISAKNILSEILTIKFINKIYFYFQRFV